MRSFRKLSLAGLAAVMVTALTVVPGASAKRQSVSSQIVVSSLTANGASGSVTGARKACRPGRKVTLYQEQTISGRPAGVPIAQTTTTKSGTWGIPMVLPLGEYFARVSRGHTKRLICRASASLPQDTG